MKAGNDFMRRFAAATVAAASVLAALFGCSSAIVRHQSPEEIELPEEGPRLISSVTVPVGIDPIKVEAVGLVTRLDGTGSDPAPSANRGALITEMRKRGVRSPHQVLASPDTSMVLVRGFLRPGIRKDETFDLEVQVPRDSETSSLRGGWLMQCELRPYTATEAGVLGGHDMAFAEGPLLVNPLATDKNDPGSLKRAYIPGGGRSYKDRSFGLAIFDQPSIAMSQRIGDAINRRFHVYASGGIKRGVATPKEDDFIQLVVHPRYKDNLDRYIQVVQSIALKDSLAERPARIESLRRQLLDPLTSPKAALQLEAIGKDGVEALKAGLTSDSLEVRFYSAESLAYLDEAAGCEILAAAAQNEPAFRVYALSALSAMDDPQAHDVLVQLLKESSAETRYGAFRSLWAMRQDDPMIAGEYLGKEFSLHVLEVDGPQMLHLTRSYRPEIVLFGGGIPVRLPVAIEAGKDIVIRDNAEGELVVSSFRTDVETNKLEVPARLDALIRAIQQVGGRYPDVIQALFEARKLGAIQCRIEIDALPQPGRRYDRNNKSADEEDSAEVAAGENDRDAEDGVIQASAMEHADKAAGDDDDNSALGNEAADSKQVDSKTEDDAEPSSEEDGANRAFEKKPRRAKRGERLHSPSPNLFGG